MTKSIKNRKPKYKRRVSYRRPRTRRPRTRLRKVRRTRKRSQNNLRGGLTVPEPAPEPAPSDATLLQLQDELETLGRSIRDAAAAGTRSGSPVAVNPSDLERFRELTRIISEVGGASAITEARERMLCVVCRDNLRNTTLQCGHTELCESCADMVSVCPLCRRATGRVIREAVP